MNEHQPIADEFNREYGSPFPGRDDCPAAEVTDQGAGAYVQVYIPEGLWGDAEHDGTLCAYTTSAQFRTALTGSAQTGWEVGVQGTYGVMGFVTLPDSSTPSEVATALHGMFEVAVAFASASARS